MGRAHPVRAWAADAGDRGHRPGAGVWRSGVLSRPSGVPFALGFALYIPQFFGNQPIRVAHGLLVAAGCLWLAAGIWRSSG